MDAQEILHALGEALGDDGDGGLVDVNRAVDDPYGVVATGRLIEACELLRDDARFAMDYLRCLSGVDREDRLEVVYHLVSLSKKHTVALKVYLDRDDPRVASVSAVWHTADWHERETYDLFGIRFLGHPDLRRILLPDDWVGYPLRKDYEPPAEYHGIAAARPNPLDKIPKSHAPAGGEGDAHG